MRRISMARPQRTEDETLRCFCLKPNGIGNKNMFIFKIYSLLYSKISETIQAWISDMFHHAIVLFGRSKLNSVKVPCLTLPLNSGR